MSECRLDLIRQTRTLVCKFEPNTYAYYLQIFEDAHSMGESKTRDKWSRWNGSRILDHVQFKRTGSPKPKAVLQGKDIRKNPLANDLCCDKILSYLDDRSLVRLSRVSKALHERAPRYRRTISVANQTLSPSFYRNLGRQFPRLTQLSLRNCGRIRNTDLVALASGCRNLKKLSIDTPGSLCFVGLAALVTFCPHLEEIEFKECGYFRSASLYFLAISLRPWSRICFARCSEMSKEIVKEYREKFPTVRLTLIDHPTLFKNETKLLPKKS